MMVIEEVQVAETQLPLAMLKQHLRLGRGFDLDDVQDDVLAVFLRAALAAIEARTSKALIRRCFVLICHGWTDPLQQKLPIAPVSAVLQVETVGRDGLRSDIPAARWWLRQDATQPVLVADGASLPAIPTGGRAEVRIEAGFASEFADLPADLAQAVMLLAAHYYEYRDETALSEGCMPFGVTSLIARYRPLHLGLTR